MLSLPFLLLFFEALLLDALLLDFDFVGNFSLHLYNAFGPTSLGPKWDTVDVAVLLADLLVDLDLLHLQLLNGAK